jgi:hypothetical protein
VGNGICIFIQFTIIYPFPKDDFLGMKHLEHGPGQNRYHSEASGSFRKDGVANGQWEFQEPKLEVPTIYKAYIRPM